MAKKNGGSAFACAGENGHQAGMSVRDYFAGQALVGMLTRGPAHTHDAKMIMTVAAYQYADAMLAAREES